MNVKEEIQKTIQVLKQMRKFKSQAEIAEFLNYNPSYFSRALNSGDIPMDLEDGFFKAFPKSIYLYSNQKEFSDNIIAESNTEYNSKKPEPQKLSEKTYKKEVTVIPAKAQLGLQSFLYPEEMMKELETKIIYVDQDYKGKYYEIECVGDSMDADHRNAIREGDSVLCREISKLHWQNAFHKNDWEFVFFHNEYGIIIKCIKDQDLTNGNLTLCSYNPDKEEYPDFVINIKECYAICNVVQVIQNRKKYYTL